VKAGAEQRKKTLLAAGLGTVALICVIYAYTALFGGDTPATPPPSIIASSTTASTAPARLVPGINAPITGGQASASTSTSGTGQAAMMPSGNAAGVDAKKMAGASSSLDPTLDETAMLRTESLVYSGAGRDIFSATYTPPPSETKVLKPIASARPGPAVYTPPPAPQTCPPSCPPIALKFFGTAQHGTGARQAFLLQGDDVYLASAGEVVGRKYKIVSIGASSIQVEDLANRNTQTLPLQQ
jgi:hypothetical protein